MPGHAIEIVKYGFYIINKQLKCAVGIMEKYVVMRITWQKWISQKTLVENGMPDIKVDCIVPISI